MGVVSGSDIALLCLFLPCPLEFLEDHHRKEVLDSHLFPLKYGGSFDSVSAQLFIVPLIKGTSLVRSLSDLCSYKVFTALLILANASKLTSANSVTLGQRI